MIFKVGVKIFRLINMSLKMADDKMPPPHAMMSVTQDYLTDESNSKSIGWFLYDGAHWSLIG